MKKNKIAIILCLVIAASILSVLIKFDIIKSSTTGVISEVQVKEPDKAPVIVNPATLFVESLNVGWNLGNTLDSLDIKKQGILTTLKNKTPEEFYETLWQNPVTTNEMIKTVADAGFGAVRVPVTYSDHMDENFKISDEWLNRVEEVVNYVLNNNMYCIINIHHDTGKGSWPWLKADPENLEVNKERLAYVWEQIAVHFQDYDGRLAFEGFNEILDVDNNWQKANVGSYDITNQLNQVFVDTVRNTPGNNPQRFLIVNTYGAGTDAEMLNAFVLPKDTIEDHLIVGVHSYAPLEFTWTQEQLEWGEAHSVWDIEKDQKEVDIILKRLKTSFTDRGIPVILGEFGAWNKNNTEDRVSYASYVVKTAKSFGISCFWWDNGGKHESAAAVDNPALLDRYTNQWYYPEIVDALVIAASK